MLPTDRRLRRLTPFHRIWILDNIRKDLEQQQQLVEDRSPSKSVSFGQVNRTEEEYGIDDPNEFRAFSDKMKKIADQQAADMPVKTEAKSG